MKKVLLTLVAILLLTSCSDNACKGLIEDQQVEKEFVINGVSVIATEKPFIQAQSRSSELCSGWIGGVHYSVGQTAYGAWEITITGEDFYGVATLEDAFEANDICNQ